MRLLLIVIFVVILGGSLGIAHTWGEFSSVQDRMELPAAVQVDDGEIADATANQRSVDTIGPPRAEVLGDSSHDFGILTRDASRSHSFVLRNGGNDDLIVEKSHASCGLCVLTTFTSATVKPGEELTIPITLRARKPGPALNEHLEVRTNDGAHEVIRFDLIAYVSDVAGASVSELALGTISTDEGAAASFNIYGFASQPLEIVDCKLHELGDNLEYFDWEISDLTQDAVKAGQAQAKFGKQISLTVKPGLPVGPVKQNFTIVARVGKEVTINVPISGQVTGDLSLMGGSKFNPDKSLLSLGRILSTEGASAKLLLMVKGEHRADVEVTVGECDPVDYLSATIGEPKPIRDGEAYLYPVTIKVSQNVPPVNRLGGVRSAFGKIVIQTTHPTAKLLTLNVRFAVE